MRPVSDASRAAVRRGHQRTASVYVWQPSGMVGRLPIEDGRLTWSLSRGDGIRGGQLTVAGYDWWQRLDPGLGTWVTVDVEIEGQRWEFGEWPILRVAEVWPRGVVEVTLGDWAYRRAQPDAESSVTVGSAGWPVGGVLRDWMDPVLPDGCVVTRDDSGGAAVSGGVEVQLGGSIWQALVALANQIGCVPVITSRGTAEIRSYWTGPVCDSMDGAVIERKTAIVVDEAVNRVVVVAEQSAPGAASATYRSEVTLTDGPYKYDRSGIGRLALVQTMRQPVVTQAQVDAEAARIYDRRAGIVRSVELDVIPMPWLEVGDVIDFAHTLTGSRLSGLIDSMTFPLTGSGVQQMVLRDAAIR